MGQSLASAGDCAQPALASPPPSPLSRAALVSKLCFAAAKGDVESCRSVMELDVDVNSADYDRRTALHVAAADGQLGVLRYLLEVAADVNRRDRWGHSPLDEALALESPARGPIEAALRAAGASASPPAPSTTREAALRSNGKSASPAAPSNTSEVAFQLAELPPGGETPQKYAGDVEIDSALLLCCAAAAGSIESVQGLYARRADLNSVDYDGRTALHVACAHGHAHLVEWLIQMRADCQKRDSFGLTPLGEAMRLGQDRVARFLVDAGAKEDSAGLENIRLSADAGLWRIPAKEVEISSVLSKTLKSIIYLALWRGTKVVAKTASVLNIDKEDKVSDEDRVKNAQEIVHEIQLLSTLRHPDLVMFLGACFDHDTPFFITEFMEGGDLECYYRSQKNKTGNPYRAPAEKLMRWSSSVARALCFLHGCQQPIIHRDLKPLNLLLNRSEDVKVTDFGISKLMAPKVQNDDRPAPYMSGGVGTWRYMAPEVVRYQPYNDKADIFSFALIMWFMSTGRQPFFEQFGEDAALVLHEYQRGGEPRPELGTSAHGRPGPRMGSETAAFRQLVQDCWHVAPTSRPSGFECTQRLAAICAKVDVGPLSSLKESVSFLKDRMK